MRGNWSSHSLTIFELEQLVALSQDICRLWTSLDIKLNVPTLWVIAIRALYEAVGSWWMVRGLLQIDLCTILPCDLKSLTQDWVQRLLKYAVVVLLCSVGSNDALYTFDGVWGLCSSIIKVNTHRALAPTLELKLGVVCHTFDWKANPGHVKGTRVDPFADYFDKFFEGTPNSIGRLLVKQLIAPRWTGVRASIVASLLWDLKSFCKLQDFVALSILLFLGATEVFKCFSLNINSVVFRTVVRAWGWVRFAVRIVVLLRFRMSNVLFWTAR